MSSHTTYHINNSICSIMPVHAYILGKNAFRTFMLLSLVSAEIETSNINWLPNTQRVLIWYRGVNVSPKPWKCIFDIVATTFCLLVRNWSDRQDTLCFRLFGIRNFHATSWSPGPFLALEFLWKGDLLDHCHVLNWGGLIRQIKALVL